MFVVALLSLVLLQSHQTAGASAPVSQTGEPVAESSGRPATPYSLPPVSSQLREGASPRLVPRWAPGVVENKVDPVDDSVPLPIPAVFRETPSGDVVEQPATGDPHFLGFVAGSHYPPAGEDVDVELWGNALTHYLDGRPQPETYAFVMFQQRMTEARLAQLEVLGCRLLGFHPHYAHKVALPATAIDTVAALPFVRWIGVPRQWQKVHPALVTRLADAQPNQPVEVWVSVFESDLGASSVRRSAPGPITVDPGGFPVHGEPGELRDVWITNGWQQRALEAAGLEVVSFAGRANAFRARLMPQGLDLVTALDFVQFVESDDPVTPKHDETMALVNADDARNYYGGGSNLRTIAGIVDSGLENSHGDLNHFYAVGWDQSASTGAWNDDCGHGTHVAGTMLGNGDLEAGHTGAAPGLGWSLTGRLFNVRIFSSCAPQSVDEAAVLSHMSNAYTASGVTTPRPHVINNSWGTDGNSAAPWVGTETECRLYDDNAYSDGQLNVFAASNEGPAAGTIGKHASAKNVLTVGNVLDYSSGAAGPPGSLWTTSSRGPTGDGRWKPNLVAPGRWVTSADAGNLFGYVEMFDTSTAAPHVTGVVANLIDADASFTYLPESIAAHLMATSHTKGGVLLSTAADTHLDLYGAGRVDATRAIWNSGGTSTHWAFSLSPGGATYADFTVPSGTTRIVAVMHYIEPAGSAGGSSALVNDWDFYLDQPPIDPAGNTGNWFNHQSTVDNTEIRSLSGGTPGTWRWKIWPSSTSTTAYFGVSIYVQTSDPTPSIAPTLTTSTTHAKPFQTVTMDYNLATSGGSISGVFLDSTVSGAALISSRTYLEDGAVTDLLGNVHSGWDVALGNVDPFFSRDAQWQLFWNTEGFKTFSVETTADNAPSSDTQNEYVIVDGTPPGLVTNLASTSHTPGVWSNDPTVDMVWTAAVDPVSGGVASGIDGYGHLVSSAPTPPPTVLTMGAVSGTTTSALATGSSYFNVRAADRSGNWGAAASYGPLDIDLTAPSAATGLASSTHAVDVLSCESNISFSWSPATDGHSGIAGYSVVIDNNPATTPAAVPNVFATGTASSLAFAADWYLHVRAVDNVGNAGASTHLGPFPFDPNPVTTYCTAKLNSQGCTPAVYSAGAPSLSGGLFQVYAKNVLNNKNGLLFWGFQSTANPFQGGIKCVANPVNRTPVQDSNGNPPPDDCSGAYFFDFTTAYMTFKGISPGDTIHCQFWSRDPLAPFTTGLTDALRAVVCP